MTTTTLTQWAVAKPPHLGSPRNIKARFGVRHLIYNPASIPWRLIGTVVALFILFEKAAPMLRLIDPTAAVLDIGSFSLVLFGALALVTFLSVAHWLIGLLWPVIRQYQKHHFHNNFKSLQPWQKIMFYLIIFFGLLYAFVCCFAAVF